MKIGTGQNNTVEGKIYLDKTLENEGKGWVLCQNKLYLRKKRFKDIGKLLVIDPSTFEVEGEIDLCCDSIMKEKKANCINQNFPLILVKGDSNDRIGVVMA